MNGMNQEHTVKRYDDELDHLKHRMLAMGSAVADQIEQALAAFKHEDPGGAERVVAGDRDVDRMEVAADELVVKLIAQRSPVASDLRTVLALSKCCSDLERSGNEAVAIATAVIEQSGPGRRRPKRALVCDVNRIGAMAVQSLRSALGLFESWSEEGAQAVIAQQRDIDDELKGALRCLMTYVLEDCRLVGYAITLILVMKSLERIARYGQNIAEYAVFRMKGEDVRLQGS